MSFFKNLGDKAKVAANAVGTKSQEVVEIGKLKMSISTLESDIKKLKLEIGELAYDAHKKSQSFPVDLIEKIISDIDGKFVEIKELNEKIATIQAKDETNVAEAPPAEAPVTEAPVAEEPTEEVKVSFDKSE